MIRHFNRQFSGKTTNCYIIMVLWMILSISPVTTNLTLISNNLTSISIVPELQAGPFPMAEFYNDSRILSFDFNAWECNGDEEFIGRFPVRPCCDCDESCWKYGTCCIDNLWNKNMPIELKMYINIYKTKLMQYKQTSCEEILTENKTDQSKKHEIEPLYMISTCLPTASKQSIEFCQNASKTGAKGSIPVLGKDTYLYRNEFCAKCNNIFLYELQRLEVKCVDVRNIRNGKKVSLHEIYKQKECIIIMKRTNENKAFLKKCQIQKLSGVCSEEERELCRIHQGRISNGYKNYFCWKCSSDFQRNESITKLLECPAECGKQKLCFIPDNRDLSKYSYRFEVASTEKEFQVTNFHQTFPIWDFFEVPSSLTLSKDEGFEQYLCSGRRKRCCNCERTCMIDRKCCVDNLWNQTNPVNLITYKEMLIEEADHFKDHVCLPVYPLALDTPYIVQYRKLTQSCKRKASKMDKNDCFYPTRTNSPAMVVPVLGSDGELYANSFCAKCNFVNYTYVNLTVDCQSVFFQDEDFSSNTTNRTFNFDILNKTRTCRIDIIGTTSHNKACRPSGHTRPICDYFDPRYYLCKSYRAVIDNYSNFNCRTCVKNDRLTKSMIEYCDPTLKCLYGQCTGHVVINTQVPILHFRWSLTLSFSGDSANLNFNDERGTLESNCFSGQYYDINQGKCVTITCPPGYQISGLDCIVDDNLHAGNVGLGKSGKTHDKSLLSREYFAYFQLINKSFINALNLTFTTFKVINNRTVFRSIAPIHLTDLGELVQNSQAHLKFDIHDFVIGMKVNLFLSNSEYKLDFSRFFSGNRLCAVPVTIPYNEFGSNETKFIYQNKTINIADLSYWISFQNNELTHHYSMCSQFHLFQPCARRLILNDRITKTDNMTIKYNNSKGAELIYKASDYFPTNTGYYVCLQKNDFLSTPTTIYQDLAKLFEVEYYITIVGTSISIACYLCIIFTYIIFKDLRTIAGLNNCFMCFSLLIADVMALSSMKASENYISCFTVSIIMHWSLLAAFSWTLVIAFDLVSRFGSLISNSNENMVKKMARRAVFGFLLPAFVVALAIGLDKSGAFEFGYGDFQICWRINNPSARIAFYIVPTALVTLIALASLWYTVRIIAITKKETEKHLGPKEHSQAPLIRMAVKLSIILGLSEIFGYIQIPGSNDDVEYFNVAFGFMYTFLRSLRGVMLWFVYMHGSSVANRYKKLWEKAMNRMHGHEISESESTSELPMSVYTISR